MSRILHVLAISLALAPAARAQTSLQSAGSEMLVSAGQLAGQLHDPALVVLHVADRESAFTEGHIPGARFVRYGDFAVDGDTGVGSELVSTTTRAFTTDRSWIGQNASCPRRRGGEMRNRMKQAER